MKYNVISYFLSEGFRNVFKNKKSTGASLMIMCATMLIFGLFFLIGQNVLKRNVPNWTFYAQIYKLRHRIYYHIILEW